MTKTQQLLDALSRWPGCLVRARFVKGDTPAMRKRRRRRPEVRDMDFVVHRLDPYPKQPYIVRVWDEQKQDYRHENLRTTKRLEIIDENGEVVYEFRAQHTYDHALGRLRTRRGTFAPLSEENLPGQERDAEAEYEAAKRLIHELF